MKTIIDCPDSPFAQLILAHGAGADKHSEFMNTMASLLCKRGVKVIRFDFPYMLAAREKQKRQPPNRMPILIDDFIDRVNDADTSLPLFVGGKSMGGRVATMLPLEKQGKGVICLGYPFHPPRKPEKHRTEHLLVSEIATLIVQGERDTFGNRERIAQYALSNAIEVKFLIAADHSFVPLKSSGLTLEQHMDAAANHIVEFMQGQL
ncbi:alpha/beta family hydrolase [Aliiglaciecola litoralis]|uniref:KANL3/Tex30 alpha/beta hydrolase-like domain-containing protein n=1 Tax=Aliiglaciecola litoralis TaxID=582857 RepID=A0ABP3X213_9ALTE